MEGTTRGHLFRRASLVVTLSTTFAAASPAHEIGTARVEACFHRDGAYTVQLYLDPVTLLGRLQGKPAEPSIPAEILRVRLESYRQAILGRISLSFDGQRIEPRVGIASIDELRTGGAAVVRLDGIAPEAVRTFTWSMSLASGTYSIGVQREGEPAAVRQWLDADAASSPFELSRREVERRGRLATLRQYLVLGFTHIVPKGLDHILFVLGLLLLTRRARALLGQVTAFTIAHSLTLALSMYGVISLPSKVVEPLIAVSIAYVAIENIWTSEVKRRRVALVFLFGLLHGLGFAGVLTELGLPRSEFLTALVAFNLGVEAGQLAVILGATALIGSWAVRKDWYRGRIAVPASALIAAIAVYWTIERLLA